MPKQRKVDGMPLKTVIGMLESPETPEWLKKSWRKKLIKLKMPTDSKKLRKLV